MQNNGRPFFDSFLCLKVDDHFVSISGLEHLKLTLVLESKDLANKEIGDQQKQDNKKNEIHRRIRTALKRRSRCYNGETVFNTCCPTYCHFILSGGNNVLLSVMQYFSGNGTRFSVFSKSLHVFLLTCFYMRSCRS